MVDSIEGVAVWILLELLVIFLGMVAPCSTTFTCMRRVCEGEFKLTVECLSNIREMFMVVLPRTMGYIMIQERIRTGDLSKSV